jgi:acetyl-CoA synthetase
VSEESLRAFRAARDTLLLHRDDYDAALGTFRWPELDEFNWALEWFDVVARGNDGLALWVVDEDGNEAKLTYAELAARSDRVANWLRDLGVRRGDSVLLMLGNLPELWETFLAAMKLGAVLIPATTLLQPDDLADRLLRGNVRHAIVPSAECGKFDGLGSDFTRVAVGDPVEGWHDYAAASGADARFVPDGPTLAGDTFLLYFTSGTTAKPKLVDHTHASYPAGHLSTMYWIGLRPGDVHVNISSPGWAKHAWSSMFAPFNAEATVLVHDYARFDARRLLELLVRCEVTTLCAPPTVWRMLIQEDIAGYDVRLRDVVAAGEPLNPEVIEQVRAAWGLTVRDGYGQTETTAQIGNSPGQPVKAGSMGRPLPGYPITLVDPVSGEVGDEGEICLDLADRPLGLMKGYRTEPGSTETTSGDNRFYRTGDVAFRDEDGYITYIGRADDVFKASDYRISPFELESVLIEHPAVAEAAVVPSPDALRLSVPKAFVVLAAGRDPTRETAMAIFRHSRERLAPYKRVRRIEFADLPKTISGKIRRVDLRTHEEEIHRERADTAERAVTEYWEEDFPELRA